MALVKEGNEGVLPRPKGVERVRRLGMYATTRKVETEEEAVAVMEEHEVEGSVKKVEGVSGKSVMSQNELSHWQPMHELVARAEANQVKVRPYDKSDRFYAWRVRTKKFEAKKMARAAGGKTGKKAKKVPLKHGGAKGSKK